MLKRSVASVVTLWIFTASPAFGGETRGTTKALIPYEGARPIHIWVGPRPAHAIDYELIVGKGVEVCEAYEKNLDSIVADQTCARYVNPELKDFGKPRWQPLDAWQHRELIKGIENFLHSYPHGRPEENLNEWEKSTKAAIGYGHLRLELAEIDIDNDGKSEAVMKYHDSKCLMAHTYATLLFALNEVKNDLDILKTMHLARSRVDKCPYPDFWTPAGIWGDTLYDVFIYKGKSYFDKEEIGYPIRQQQLHVFATNREAVSGITDHLCTYRIQTPPLPGQD
ncbi:MAG: hypothetical protein ACREV1_11600 [Gammaproteobacteria bacterium]